VQGMLVIDALGMRISRTKDQDRVLVIDLLGMRISRTKIRIEQRMRML
jgi:hypothetical protein